ncbi:MAG: response regulator [Bacteroidales bacterium]|nr:response regulator [Bacteroidales bacterium]
MRVFGGSMTNLLGLPSHTPGSLTLDRLTLSFTGDLAKYEKDYLADNFEKSLTPFRFSLILAMIFYGAFAFLDAISVPQLKEVFWLIRFGIVYPVLIAVFAFSFSNLFKKYMQPIISFIMFLTGFGIIIMIILAARVSNYSYYAGLILIFIFGYTFIRARFIYASVSGWLIVITYEISAIWISDTPMEILVNNNYFFISANIIGMFISYFLELSSRNDFYMRLLLQHEQENVQNANNALEKRVRERTQQLTTVNQNLKKEIETRKKYEKERAELETQLFQLKKMETIGTLAGGIAHDFNNILTPILGYTDMALEELPDESTLKFDLEQINNAAIRGKDLVQQILTFSREVNFEKKPIELNNVVVEVLNLLKGSFPPGIEVRQKLDPETGTILADATHMHQIIMNLCTNASFAMIQTGGVLEVSLDVINVTKSLVTKVPNLKTGKYIKLAISDTGHGMDSKTRERIFEPFFTRKEVGSGSGLGLSVVHGIVNNYGGAITVDSTPGQGTLFTIYLPQHGTKPASLEELNKTVTKGNEYILFVDDEQEITYMGKKMLENLGYRVTIKTDSLSALEEFRENPMKYSLLVTDLTMPKLFGTELADEMRLIRPELKVIVITGYIDTISEEMKEKHGISEIIMKPLILSDFSKVIRKVLDEN